MFYDIKLKKRRKNTKYSKNYKRDFFFSNCNMFFCTFASK